MDRPDRGIVEEVAVGLVAGAKESGMAIIGGETAIVPELLAENGGFDLVGFAAGICKKRDLIQGDKVEKDDCLVGVASSGIHSNGLSLARKVLLEKFSLRDKPSGLERSLGEELLEPTRIYVKAVRQIMKKSEIHGLAHITGGGAFLKLKRIVGQAGVGAEIDDLPDPPGIFQLIRKEGRVSEQEMYRTFNMGIGLVVVCPESDAKKVIRDFARHRQAAKKIGRVVEKTGIRLNGKSLN
jgi:phosphoribosylformylglycinamidine cyclo-ligase